MFVFVFSVKPECLLSHCIVAPMLALDPALPANITLKELPALSPSFSAAKEVVLMSKPFQPPAVASVLVFHSQTDGTRTRKMSFDSNICPQTNPLVREGIVPQNEGRLKQHKQFREFKRFNCESLIQHVQCLKVLWAHWFAFCDVHINARTIAAELCFVLR